MRFIAEKMKTPRALHAEFPLGLWFVPDVVLQGTIYLAILVHDSTSVDCFKACLQQRRPGPYQQR